MNCLLDIPMLVSTLQINFCNKKQEICLLHYVDIMAVFSVSSVQLSVTENCTLKTDNFGLRAKPALVFSRNPFIRIIRCLISIAVLPGRKFRFVERQRLIRNL